MSKPTAQHDSRPSTLRKDVEWACQAASIIALTVSIELNIYAHTRIEHMGAGIAWTIGIAIPLLVAILAHVAAHVNFHWTVKIWVFAIVGALMFVSATSGTRVLSPGLSTGPAVIASYGLDLAALTALGFLMHNTTRKEALARWQEREADREIYAKAAEASARVNAPAAKVTARVTAGVTPEVTAGVTAGGNAPALPAGNSITAAAVPGSVPEATETAPAGTLSGDQDELANRRARRAAQSAEEILRQAAVDAAEGLPLGTRAYVGRHGGTNNRVGPIVGEVIEATKRIGKSPWTAVAVIAEVERARAANAGRAAAGK